jgi:glycosyltransferase involved in cell wall biosynthesis
VGLDGRPLQPGFRGHAGRGYGLYARELVAALAGAGGVELSLFFDPRLPVAEVGLPPGVERRLYPAGPFRLHHALQTYALVGAAADRASVEVFHFMVHMDAARCRVRPVVVTVHDLIPLVLGDLYARGRPLAHRLGRALERRAIEHATVVVAVSETTRADVLRLMRVPPERVRVAYPGVHPRFRPPAAEDVARVRARYGLERPYLVYVGGVDRHKNVALLLEAYARVRGRAAEAPDLVLAGDVEKHPEFPALRRHADKLRLGDSLRLAGYVPDADLPALVGGAALLAHPSLYEGFGSPPAEALACGTPVVGLRAGALPEVLGNAAWLVTPGDVEALAGGIERVLSDPELRATLRERGLARASGYSWDAAARATMEAYRDAAVPTRGQGRR